MNASFLYPWQIEIKATPFSRYVVVAKARSLESAIAKADSTKQTMRAYRVRVRPS